MHHTKEVLEGNQIVNECLQCLLKAFEQEEEVVVNKGEVSHVVRDTRVDIGSQLYDVLISM